ncbi:hypothetical protein A2771_01735 [Candidatus Woesebacteria bacterium RIFCSPHIGHO2_01_FULL_38_26b]|uniref:Uncharacterized protein n=1 Tax=Candidatus Woesebacteria bacterium RIFCSPHIGHO2_01_FULL_38_26b TaxID=1802491 RepID=A0A1F7XXK1_9BACT|nr:MAG: hypothetical protein A2771_01735 [Candidatus Woesebacteria bacterium RIFCSPHIGHO2_01_FULL_38_26b]
MTDGQKYIFIPALTIALMGFALYFLLTKNPERQKWDDWTKLEPLEWCDKYTCSDFMVDYLQKLDNVNK